MVLKHILNLWLRFVGEERRSVIEIVGFYSILIFSIFQISMSSAPTSQSEKKGRFVLLSLQIHVCGGFSNEAIIPSPTQMKIYILGLNLKIQKNKIPKWNMSNRGHYPNSFSYFEKKGVIVQNHKIQVSKYSWATIVFIIKQKKLAIMFLECYMKL